MKINADVRKITDDLMQFVEKEDYKGWDPFDGLNSKLFKKLPLHNNKFVKLAWIQFFKRSSVNFRNFAGVPKEYNNKGLALFLSGYCSLYRLENNEDYLKKIKFLCSLLIKNVTKGYHGACWGYNFDWQARAFFQPEFTPTVVASTYCGFALAEAYDLLHDEEILETVISIKEFILQDLNKTYDDKKNFSFSYSPLDSTSVFNASLLGSKMLARIYSYTKDEELLENARKSVQFCVDHQGKDGSWAYGTLPFHYWIDSFHTGFNLECIEEYQKYSSDKSFEKNIELGYQYYINNFFTEEGIPKYYNNQIYPVDVHAPAQLLITLCRLNKLNENEDLVNKVLTWTVNNMRDKTGYFYYRVNKTNVNKIQYIRWSQAWMFHSLALLCETNGNKIAL